MFLVGGAVRDLLREEKNKDYDFAVKAGSFAEMRDWLDENGFEIFTEAEKYFTIRAKAPKGTFVFGGLNLTNTTFDFTLCRKERDYTDGRHPDQVEIGTLLDDLSRRDFTMNAIALDKEGRYLDPFDGKRDIRYGVIDCVEGVERLEEDGLRIMRALRFQVQLGFDFSGRVHHFLRDRKAVEALKPISQDRIRQELAKALKIDSMATLGLLQEYPRIANHIFRERGLWLEPTTAKR
jgi:tRNA nucleotidyltransferase (CCA-adding enzyme)